MNPIKFYRVETLPEVGEVGSLYFVYGSGGVQSLLYICVGNGLFELYTPDINALESKIEQCKLLVLITYNDLKTLRDNNQLVIGLQYRIIDYVTTTGLVNSQSALHPFDIIVVADSANTLNENARAILREDDYYFRNNNLAAWLLKYCIDNNLDRFAWAVSDGYGVIYYLKDEFNNECAYDFKNILLNGRYTFDLRSSVPTDSTIQGDANFVYNNVVKASHMAVTTPTSGYDSTMTSATVIGSSAVLLKNYDIEYLSYNSFLGTNIHNVTIESDSYNNVLIGYTSLAVCNIIIGAYSYKNYIAMSSFISLGSGCYLMYFNSSNYALVGNGNGCFHFYQVNNISMGNHNYTNNYASSPLFSGIEGVTIGNSNVFTIGNGSHTPQVRISKSISIGSNNYIAIRYGYFILDGVSVGNNNSITFAASNTNTSYERAFHNITIGNDCQLYVRCYTTGLYIENAIIGDGFKGTLYNNFLQLYIFPNCKNVDIYGTSSGPHASNFIIKPYFGNIGTTITLSSFEDYGSPKLKEISPDTIIF